MHSRFNNYTDDELERFCFVERGHLEAEGELVRRLFDGSHVPSDEYELVAEERDRLKAEVEAAQTKRDDLFKLVIEAEGAIEKAEKASVEAIEQARAAVEQARSVLTSEES